MFWNRKNKHEEELISTHYYVKVYINDERGTCISIKAHTVALDKPFLVVCNEDKIYMILVNTLLYIEITSCEDNTVN